MTKQNNQTKNTREPMSQLKDSEMREQLEEFALHLKSGTTKGAHRVGTFDTVELTKLVQALIATHTNKLIDELLSELPEKKPPLDEFSYAWKDSGFNEAIDQVTAILEKKKK